MRQRHSEAGTVARTWGPFTGRQLTTILCVLIVTVLFPVTAWAVSGTSVFVTDKATGKTAAVDANRNLQTKVNGGTVSVNGVVSGNIAPATSFVESHEVTLSTSFLPILTPATGKEIIVTEIQEDWSGDNLATASYVTMTIGDAGTCANASNALGYFFDLPTGAGNHVVPFTPGYIVPHGKSLCVEMFGTSAPNVFFAALGYTVPAGTVAAPAVALGAGAHATRH